MNRTLQGLSNVMLFITSRCNFQCDYCYIRQGQHTMPFAVAKKAIDNVDDGTIIDFFGGEALLEIDLLHRIVDYAASEGRQLVFQLFSNGSRWHPEVESLLAKGVSLGVSYDGLDQFHRTHSEHISQRVQANILAMKRAIPGLSVKTCISPDNVVRMMANVKYMNGLGLNSVSQFLIREDVWKPADIAEYRDQFAREVEYLCECLSADNGVWLSYPAMFAIGSHRHTGCWAGSSGCAVNWNGDLYPCQRFLTTNSPFVIGTVDTGITNPQFQRYSIDNFLKCGSCDLRDRCSHLCIAAQWESGCMTRPIPSICELNHLSYELAKPLEEFREKILQKFGATR